MTAGFGFGLAFGAARFFAFLALAFLAGRFVFFSPFFLRAGAARFAFFFFDFFDFRFFDFAMIVLPIGFIPKLRKTPTPHPAATTTPPWLL